LFFHTFSSVSSFCQPAGSGLEELAGLGSHPSLAVPGFLAHYR
jgi:hypothetical protein